MWFDQLRLRNRLSHESFYSINIVNGALLNKTTHARVTPKRIHIDKSLFGHEFLAPPIAHCPEYCQTIIAETKDTSNINKKQNIKPITAISKSPFIDLPIRPRHKPFGQFQIFFAVASWFNAITLKQGD